MRSRTDVCGCCEGIEKLTPLPTANRPGLPRLLYRVGSHATFLETMLARLSNHYIEVPLDEVDEQGTPRTKKIYPLQGLRTHLPEDPAIALLDAWATVADVLTFYQERIANEGYLRTATERRSVLELARLVGYKLRPGAASSVFLAYTLDENSKDEVVIPRGARSQSVPGPSEMPQPFETSEELKARAKWNNLRPRTAQPQTKDSICQGDGSNMHLYLKGISTYLKPNDPLLIQFKNNDTPKFHRVKKVKADPAKDRTLVTLQTSTEVNGTSNFNKKSEKVETSNVSLIKALTLPPSVQVPNSLRLSRSLKAQFTSSAETGYAAVSTLAPLLRDTFYRAAANAQVTTENTIKVYALRLNASLFGHNVPKEPQYEPNYLMSGELQEPNPNAGHLMPQKDWKEWEIDPDETKNTLYLDRKYNEILPRSFAIIIKGQDDPSIFKVQQIQYLSRNAYGISGDTTKVTLDRDWWSGWSTEGDDIRELRTTSVYAQSEELELAEEPFDAPVCDGAEHPIELDGFYEGLEAGRWVVVSGERDIADTSGVRFSELAMLSVVEHKRELEGDKTHTFIKFAEKLKYSFKRDTATIYCNVAKATNGETRKGVLGSGDGTKPLQSFTLKQPPLTFVSAPNPSGVDSTLKVTVNSIEWHETDSLAGLSPTSRRFITKTDDEGKTTVTFGNGREGARLPTGIENIKAEYRNGIGKAGNVKAEQITLLMTCPLGVKDVVNPLRASGGADKENRDQARKNAPLAVKALDRLVSVQDYEDFARFYAGIGKACATGLSDGRRQVVHVTIAGADDIPIDETSDLFINLRQALRDFGDPFQPILLAVRELVLIVISARVRILPDYNWESVVTAVRSALLDAFSFEQRELGQDVLLSEIISVMQGVRGVAYVDVDVLRGIPEKIPDPSVPGQRRLLAPDEIAARVTDPLNDGSINTFQPLPRIRINLADHEDTIIRPAQLAFLTPDVPSTLILNQIT